MKNSQRIMAVLNYQHYDRLPVVHFGYWTETLQKWAQQGHISDEIAQNWSDGSPVDLKLNSILGFDTGWGTAFNPKVDLFPSFESKLLKLNPDGSKHLL